MTADGAFLCHPLLLLLVSSLCLLPAVPIKERAGAPGVVLRPDVHIGVLRSLVCMLMGMRQVPDGHANAEGDSCTRSKQTSEH